MVISSAGGFCHPAVVRADSDYLGALTGSTRERRRRNALRAFIARITYTVAIAAPAAGPVRMVVLNVFRFSQALPAQPFVFSPAYPVSFCLSSGSNLIRRSCSGAGGCVPACFRFILGAGQIAGIRFSMHAPQHIQIPGPPPSGTCASLAGTNPVRNAKERPWDLSIRWCQGETPFLKILTGLGGVFREEVS